MPIEFKSQAVAQKGAGLPRSQDTVSEQTQLPGSNYTEQEKREETVGRFKDGHIANQVVAPCRRFRIAEGRQEHLVHTIRLPRGRVVRPLGLEDEKTGCSERLKLPTDAHHVHTWL